MTHGSFMNVDRPDVGRQVEVVVRLVLAVPAVARGEVRLGGGIGGALSHGGPPETGAAPDRGAAVDRIRLAGGAAGSNPSSSGARRRSMVAPGPCAAGRELGRSAPAELAPRPPRRAPGRRTARTRSGRRASRRAASSRRRAGVAAASRNRIEWPGVPSCAIDRSGWIVGQTQLTLAMSVLPGVGVVALVLDPVGGHVGPERARRGRGCCCIVVAPPENVTSTVVSVASAAASHSSRKRSLHRLVVGLRRRCGS